MDRDTDPARPGSPRSGGFRIRWGFLSDPSLRWLVLAAVVYVAVSFVLSWLRAIELATSTWDMGTYQQALWSTAHARPFYTAANLETDGYRSLLQVHTVFVLYPLVPLYALAPYQTTLFAVQSVAVALAAFPLYFFARDRTGSARLGLLAGVAYLAWAPTLTSNLYDFHAEAFLPLEIFAFVAFWNRDRYLAGSVVAAIAFLTLEVTPVLLFFVGLFFAISAPSVGGSPSGGTPRDPSPPWTAVGLLRRLRDSRTQASLALMVACGVAYAALEFVRGDVLVAALGLQPVPSGGFASPLPGSLYGLGLSISNLSVGFGAKLEDWMLYLALLGLVPLLAPRALVVAVPWVAFSFLSGTTVYASLGFQYGFLVSCALLVPFVCGLAVVRAWIPRFARSAGGEAKPARDREGPGSRLRGARDSRNWARGAVAGAVVLLAINLALTPADPLMQGASNGAAYQVSYDVPAGYADVERVANLVPAGVSVIASADLFPLVANDLDAYSFYWTGGFYNLYLPFDAAHLPEDVLVAENQEGAVPPWLSSVLYDPSAYGVRAVAWGSAAGVVLLFQAGYTGAASEYGGTPASAGVFGPTLAVPYSGYLATAPGSRFSDIVRSAPNLLGTMWLGPGSSAPAGEYSITVWVNATPTTASAPPASSTPVLGIGTYAFGQTALYYQELTYADLDQPRWVAVSFNVTLSGPTMSWQFEGVVLSAQTIVSLDYLEIAPAG